MKNWSIWHLYFVGIAGLLICFGVAAIVEATHDQPDRSVLLLESCNTTCNGQVESFEIDWRNQPICRCR